MEIVIKKEVEVIADIEFPYYRKSGASIWCFLTATKCIQVSRIDASGCGITVINEYPQQWLLEDIEATCDEFKEAYNCAIKNIDKEINLS